LLHVIGGRSVVALSVVGVFGGRRVVALLVVLSGLLVMLGGFLMVLRRLGVVLRCRVLCHNSNSFLPDWPLRQRCASVRCASRLRTTV